MKQKKITEVLIYFGLIVFAIIAVIPFLYMFSTSMLKSSFVIPFPPKLFPSRINFENYVLAWTGNHFGRYFANSLIVVTLSTAFIMFISCLSAYGFSRMKFPGREFLFGIFLFSMMIPSITNITPIFTIMKSLKLIDSYFGLTLLYTGISIASNTYFLRNFFLLFPHELEEAMTIEGGTKWTCFVHLLLPLSKPAIATFGILTFANNWEEFIYALVFIKTESKRTLPIAIKLFEGQFVSNWSLIFAASLIAVVPILVIYIAFQKYLIKGGSLDGTIK
ncbi:MAG: carbohydrate ABC transporter permease [Sphaerochaetaceae bacterium]|nr:carbohydrate ABC transporter permease [Sphaerochaetaceae bacterium]